MPEKANDSEDKVRSLQRSLYRAAKRSSNRRFHVLYDKMHRGDILERAWAQVRAKGGAGGVDGQTLEKIEEVGVETFLKSIHEELRGRRYRPQPVLRVEIPKPSGGKRPLGIPTVRDRVVQAACRMIMEPIFEADFLECSYGFRPKRSAHQAQRLIRRTINQGCNWVVDGDIRKYFDTIEHWKLMVLVGKRINDRRMLGLIRGWLRAGVMKEGRRESTERGTPQGGVISPLLSNIYLHFLDRQWKKKHRALGELVRYADDFVILCRRREDAEKSLRVLEELLGRLSLRLHPEKTRVVEMGQKKGGFDFLGFYFRRCASWRYPGKDYCLSWPSQNAMKRIRQKVKDITAETWRLALPLEDIAKALNPVIRGWANYFKVGNSGRKFSDLDRYVSLRVSLLRKRKYSRPRPWTYEGYQKLGIFRASGQVAWI